MISYSLAEWIVERDTMVRRIDAARADLHAAERADDEARYVRAESELAAATAAYERSRARAETNFGEREVTAAVNALVEAEHRAREARVRYADDRLPIGRTDDA